MTETLSERIARRGFKRRPSPQANRVAFLALKGDIHQLLYRGRSILAIWEAFHEKGAIGFSYQTFRRLVNREIFRR